MIPKPGKNSKGKNYRPILGYSDGPEVIRIHLPMQKMWVWSSGEGNENLLQYSHLEYPMDRGAWWATVHGVAKELDTT